ncbi:MAG: 3-oxoacyl-[acyl-carrier-protein] reductase [Porphyromonas sp.]|nr:3-oxoacyl-[acyl-carrier-protein] reductase [Porphyromonas sp.]
MKLLEGKVAIITGASRGIGKAVARKYAEEGASVALTARNINDEVLAFVAELETLGVKAKAYTSDASIFDSAHELVREVHQEFGRIDILVNNAGITQDALMMRMTEEQWDNVININLKGAFNLIHAVTPIMMKQRSGNIINMSSVVGVSGNAGQANYAASKAGMIGLTMSIAKEMGSRGIRANTIAPGFISTDMTHALSEDIRKQWEAQIPLRRGGTPEDIAGVAVFLASDMASYITGQTINVCGGMNI